MKIKNALRCYIFGESLKKIETKLKVNSDEKLINLYYNRTNELSKDFMYLSKNSTNSMVNKLLENNRVVICNLSDRDGVIGLPIISISNDIIEMKNLSYEVNERFLYNLIYNVKKNRHSLEIQDEYYEKINIDK